MPTHWTRKRSGARGTARKQAAFLTRTLVKKNGQNALVKRRLQMMLREQTGEPELQLEQDFDPETGEVRAS